MLGCVRAYPCVCPPPPRLQVDLGAVFNITTLILFNRAFITPSSSGYSVDSNSARLAGATLQLLNYYQTPIGTITLTAEPVQTYFNITQTVIVPPTPTQTPSLTMTPSGTPSPSHTATGTQTGTQTPSASVTPTGTATPSASLSMGQSNTATGTGTPSPSITPSSTPSSSGTGSATQTGTPTPLSRYPSRVRVGVLAGAVNLDEVWVFSPSFQLLSSPALGAVASASSVNASFGPAYANDMRSDPWQDAPPGLVTQTLSTTPGGDWVDITLGAPARVGTVYVVTRSDVTALMSSFSLASGFVRTFAPSGAQATSFITGAATVLTQTFGAWSTPTLPAPSTQTPWMLSNGVRYVTVHSAPNTCLHFREVRAADGRAVRGRVVARSRSSCASHPPPPLLLPTPRAAPVPLLSSPCTMYCVCPAARSSSCSTRP
jgi:hypothetical protein